MLTGTLIPDNKWQALTCRGHSRLLCIRRKRLRRATDVDSPSLCPTCERMVAWTACSGGTTCLAAKEKALATAREYVTCRSQRAFSVHIERWLQEHAAGLLADGQFLRSAPRETVSWLPTELTLRHLRACCRATSLKSRGQHSNTEWTTSRPTRRPSAKTGPIAPSGCGTSPAAPSGPACGLTRCRPDPKATPMPRTRASTTRTREVPLHSAEYPRRSRLFRPAKITFRITARAAAIIFSLSHDRQTSPRKLILARHGYIGRTALPPATKVSEMKIATPALGPSWDRSSGHVNVLCRSDRTARINPKLGRLCLHEAYAAWHSPS